MSFWEAGVAGWRRLIGCLNLQVIFRKRATNYRALLRKMTYEDKASYDSTPPCTLHSIFYSVCIFIFLLVFWHLVFFEMKRLLFSEMSWLLICPASAMSFWEAAVSLPRLQVWMSHVLRVNGPCRAWLNQSCPHIWMGHVAHLWMSHVSRINGTYWASLDESCPHI